MQDRRAGTAGGIEPAVRSHRSADGHQTWGRVARAVIRRRAVGKVRTTSTHLPYQIVYPLLERQPAARNATLAKHKTSIISNRTTSPQRQPHYGAPREEIEGVRQ